jgi:HAD-hyrolase-like
VPSPSLRATECWTASKRPSGRCPTTATCSDSTDRAELTRCAIERAGRILGQRLDPQRTLVVGDAPEDIAAATAVGAVAVGVANGRYGEAELHEAGADYVLGSLRQPLPGFAAATVS